MFTASRRATRRSRLTSTVGGVALLALLASSCQSDAGGDKANQLPGQSASNPTGVESSESPPVVITTSLGKKTKSVPLMTPIVVTAQDGVLRSVKVRSGDVVLDGNLSTDKSSWTSTGRLEPGTDYAVVSVGVGADGKPSRTRSSFHTQDLALEAQTYPSVAPLAGETVGVGMPVIVTFDVPVQDQALFEKHMTVSSVPKQAGSWRWLSDQEVHWRPNKYWKAGTDVSVDVDVNSLPAGNGVFGQESRTIDFHVGQSVVSKVNAQTHQMRTFINGKLEKTTPITTGKPGFTTRSGTKVIIEKFRSKRMNSETVGIARDAPEGYDINDVEYAMRLTYSGEFLHAAPWSVASQGHDNVSHGCTGMSTANAKWLYDQSKRGDVVEYTGTDRPMTLTNGFGDWNLSPAEYAKGSALN